MKTSLKNFHVNIGTYRVNRCLSIATGITAVLQYQVSWLNPKPRKNTRSKQQGHILEFFWWLPGVTGHYKKIPPLYLKEKLMNNAGNLKVNWQSKDKSIPIHFSFLVTEGRPVVCNSWFFEPVIYIRNHTLGVTIDTSENQFSESSFLTC